ncbi:facilitated trehalose transporter Tret1-like [Leptopilina boulardi]|uniref:facilitated trehalose transporter Tret1-like n=1 Tax=Leptopilina boulardi TaxID=63433 RepID=UPI0021F564C2|nr:facilitated trehalose transporter Tret1-like [Leptopilina boulardi]XP_051162551.1 facilitated trehalose transporter Tret1-like [Leptopilina boulardi]XP_051162552.1 facilitated trehalose transporter Tret1-like [Leptopilina boulardi]XP_051162553.1 facilitated trehalose transporter Tret1-like [Leptopilina boulardi]XP_051162554.1 facilitated trehalose transporter Tret1-like [Leptopilina boulardi]XP_051162555.1 facilitated trehalose transporter Tret1-like [Leptopilina boulardi]
MDYAFLRQVLVGLVCNLLIMDSGFHEGWSTPLLPKLKEDKSLSIEDHETGWIINFLYLGVGLGSLLPFLLMDTIGRKGTLLAASIPKVCSWILLGLATNVTTIYIGRMLAGIGCGVTYSVAPIYLGEITSKQTRGLLSTLMAVLINIGMLIIYALGLNFSRFTSSMIAISVPIIFLLCFIWLPETAVYLTRKNRLTSAERTLQWALNRKNVDEELEEIKRIVSSESDGNNSFLESLKDVYRKNECRRAFGIVIILLSALTLSGAAPILAYQSETFSKAGYEFSVDIIIVISGCTLVAAGCICVATVKIAGKRLLLLISAPIAAISLATVAIFFTLEIKGFDVSHIKWIPIVGVVVYVISYGLALNPIPIAYIGEIFPNDVKVPAAIFCALYYAAASVIVVEFYQIIEKSYGTYLAFWSFSVITLLVTYLIYLYVPETEGKSLEEIQTELKGKKQATCWEITDLKVRS